jgi:hypothetical protein
MTCPQFLRAGIFMKICIFRVFGDKRLSQDVENLYSRRLVARACGQKCISV